MDFFTPHARIPWNYYLIDAESKCILVQPKSLNVIKVLAEGILNVGLKAFAYENLVTKNPGLDINGIDHHSEFYFFERGRFSLISPEKITPDIRKKKQVAICREKYINLLEIFCTKHVMELAPYSAATFSEAIRQSVVGSSAHDDKYHPAISEYASILNIDESAAYSELKLFQDSVVLLQMRAFGIFQKFSKKINSSFDEQEMADIYHFARQDIFFTSRI